MFVAPLAIMKQGMPLATCRQQLKPHARTCRGFVASPPIDVLQAALQRLDLQVQGGVPGAGQEL